MNRTDALFFELIETYQRHAQASRNAKYQEKMCIRDSTFRV